MIRTTLAVAALLSFAVPASAQTPAPGSSMPGMSGASSMTIPQCKTGGPVVWVNTRSKIYYMQGSKYYGKTSHGSYACLSAAKTAGNRPPKTSGMSSSQSQSPGATATGGTITTNQIPGTSSTTSPSP
jgi:hypothetical protein